MGYLTALIYAFAKQYFVELAIFTTIVVLGAGVFVAGRMTAPPSVYQQMRENERQDLIRQKNLSKHDLELLGARYR